MLAQYPAKDFGAGFRIHGTVIHSIELIGDKVV